MPKPIGIGGIGPKSQPAPAPAGGGWMGGRGSPARYDMTMQMLKSAMGAAQGTTSPLLALLAPIATSLIGARATKLYDDRRAADASAMTESLLGPAAATPQARAALDVLNNPDAPDYLKGIASTMIKQATMPTRTSAPRRSSGAPAAKKAPRLYGQPFQDANGVWGKLDGQGNFWPIAALNPAAPAAMQPPADPVLPSDPTSPIDNDPLGIR